MVMLFVDSNFWSGIIISLVCCLVVLGVIWLLIRSPYVVVQDWSVVRQLQSQVQKLEFQLATDRSFHDRVQAAFKRIEAENEFWAKGNAELQDRIAQLTQQNISLQQRVNEMEIHIGILENKLKRYEQAPQA